MKLSKILGIILTFCMLVTMLPVGVLASDGEAPTISVAAASCCAGNTVEVNIELENNPGIVSMLLKIGYDSEYFTLTGVADGGILGDNMHSDNFAANSYTLSWANDTASENLTTNGTMATLIFEVKEDTPQGNYGITIDKIECLNFNGNLVDFATTEADVSVYEYIVGDVNNDGVVDTKDRMYLSRHLADWIGYENIDERAANVNGDSELNSQDRMYLSRHLAGWLGYENLLYPGTPEVPDVPGTPDTPEVPDNPVVIDTLTVDLFDLYSMPENYSGNFRYYGEDDRLVTVSAENADVYINGVALADIANLNYYDTVSKLNRMSGTITFVLHEGSASSADYDTIYIDASMPFVVDDVNSNSYVVRGRDIGTMDAIYFAEGVNYESTLFDANGWIMDWAELKKGDVLLVQYIAKTDNTEIFNAKLVENTVEGQIVALGGYAGTTNRHVTVGDKIYSVYPSVEYNGIFRLLDNVTLYLDEKGRVLYYTKDEEEETETDDTPDNATFVIKVTEATDSDGNTIYDITGYKDCYFVTYTVDADVFSNNDEGDDANTVTGYKDGEVITDTFIDVGKTTAYSGSDVSNANFVYVDNSSPITKARELIGKLVIPLYDETGKITGFKTTPDTIETTTVVKGDGENIEKALYRGRLEEINGNYLTVDGKEIKVPFSANVYVYDKNKVASGRGFYQVDAQGYLDYDESLGLYYGTSTGEYDLEVGVCIFFTDGDKVADLIYVIK